MSTTTTWPGGATDASPTAYTIPASGELNWAALSNFLNVLATSAQSTTAQKWGVRKATASPVTVSATADCVIACQLTVPAAVAVNLPAGANKQVFCVVDATGDAATNNITINRNGSDTIAGATSLVLSGNREAVILCFNSGDTDWKIVSRTSGAGVPATVPAAGVVSSSGTALTSGGSDTGDALISAVQGDPATPTYSFVGDANTGIYRSGADTLNLVTAGNVRLQADANGVINTSSQMAFGAYSSAAQTGLADNTMTKVVFGTEEFDTQSKFASSAFTPTISGKYQLSAGVNIEPTAAATLNGIDVYLYKNGAPFKQLARLTGQSITSVISVNGSVLVDSDTDDYFEVYAAADIAAAGTWKINANQTETYFTGIKVA